MGTVVLESIYTENFQTGEKGTITDPYEILYATVLILMLYE